MSSLPIPNVNYLYTKAAALSNGGYLFASGTAPNVGANASAIFDSVGNVITTNFHTSSSVFGLAVLGDGRIAITGSNVYNRNDIFSLYDSTEIL